MTKCYACRTSEEGREPGQAFLAGIAFVISFNIDGMKKHLCERHQEVLVYATKRSGRAIPLEDRRVPEEG